MMVESVAVENDTVSERNMDAAGECVFLAYQLLK